MATPNLSKSAKLFQERNLPEDRTTRRLPSPRSNLSQNLVHAIPLAPPNPTTAVLQTEGDNPPDAHLTKPWPRGDEEIV